jgi:hypothetical protein
MTLIFAKNVDLLQAYYKQDIPRLFLYLEKKLKIDGGNCIVYMYDHSQCCRPRNFNLAPAPGVKIDAAPDPAPTS